MFAASWMTSQGVSSFSSYSAATGRMTFSAKSWTHFCIVQLVLVEVEAVVGHRWCSLVRPRCGPTVSGRSATSYRAGNRSRTRGNGCRRPPGQMSRWADVAGPGAHRRGRREGARRRRVVQPARRATRSGWSAATAPARRRCSRSSRARRPRPRASCPGRRRWATSRRTRGRAARASSPPACRTCSPGAASTRRSCASRSCGSASRRTPTERDIARFARAEEQFRDDGGYRAESDVRTIAAGLGLGDDRLDLPLTALSGGERRRVELARILFAGSDAAPARRADQPPRRRRQAVAHGIPPHATAARCS